MNNGFDVKSFLTINQRLDRKELNRLKTNLFLLKLVDFSFLLFIFMTIKNNT